MCACDSGIAETSGQRPDATVEAVELPVSKSATDKLPDIALPEEVNNDNCGINAPLPGAAYSRSEKLAIWGYAFDMSTNRIPPKITIRISALDSDAMLLFPAVRGTREDVAEALKRPELKDSGFGVEADVASLSPGRYLVSILQEADGRNLVCNSALPITLN